MNLDSTSTTNTSKAMRIKNWHLYFENGQAPRIKNLTYRLSPVDHSSITRKALLRRGAAGRTSLAVFSERVGLAARCPQRGLLLERSGPITLEHIAARTGLAQSDVSRGIKLLVSKEVAWATCVAFHRKEPCFRTAPVPQKAVACHRKEMGSNTHKPREKNVARHTLNPQKPNVPAVACHTEGVDIEPFSVKPKERARAHHLRKTSHHRPFYQTIHKER